MLDSETVKQDATNLQQSYDQTLGALDQTWRRLSMEKHPRRRARLETKANDLTYQARMLAGVHERAVKALKVLRASHPCRANNDP